MGCIYNFKIECHVASLGALFRIHKILFNVELKLSPTQIYLYCTPYLLHPLQKQQHRIATTTSLTPPIPGPISRLAAKENHVPPRNSICANQPHDGRFNQLNLTDCDQVRAIKVFLRFRQPQPILNTATIKKWQTMHS